MNATPDRLARRLRRLERVAGHFDDTTWTEAHAAQKRLADSALAHLTAVLDGEEPAPMDAALIERDAATLRQWHRQQGLDYDAICRNAGEDLLARLGAMHRRLPVATGAT